MRELGGVVLSGGAAVRLGGVDKGSIELGGRTLLDRALDALVDIDEVVVVGPDVRTGRQVTFRREDPLGGGPAAAVEAGLTGFVSLPRRVVVLAVDMPRVTAATVRRLLAAAGDADGARLVDAGGRVQHLCAVYDGPRLSAATAGDTHGLPMHRLVAGMELVDVPALDGEAEDVDTWADLLAQRASYSALGPR